MSAKCQKRTSPSVNQGYRRHAAGRAWNVAPCTVQRRHGGKPCGVEGSQIDKAQAVPKRRHSARAPERSCVLLAPIVRGEWAQIVLGVNALLAHGNANKTLSHDTVRIQHRLIAVIAVR